VTLRKRLAGSVVALAALFLIGLESWSLSASLRGRWRAQSDLRSGHLSLETYGLEPPQRKVIARLLQERYGVELRTVAGDIVSKELAAYVDAYNETMRTAINSKFGHNVYKECFDEAYGTGTTNSR
jgi:hypothetical protein